MLEGLIVIITLKDAEILEDTLDRKRVAKTRRPHFVYVERLDEFKPPEEALNKFNDLKRRYANDTDCMRYALEGSHYETYYPMKLFRDSKALATMRKLAEESKTGKQVLLIKESDRPDCNIILDSINLRIGNKVW